MTTPKQDYASTIDELLERVRAVVKAHPEALDVDTPFGLFKYGLKCDDLGPSLAQADGCLAKVRAENGWKAKP